MDQQRHIALPKLYGGPAYARPHVVPVAPIPRPISPDDLPIVAEMTEEDLALLSMRPGVAGPVVAAPGPAAAMDAQLPAEPGEARPLSIRALAERILGLRR